MRFTRTLLSALLLATPLFASAAGAGFPVDINHDSRWQIQHGLTNVNKQMAKNIVQYRQEHGDFTDKSQLLAIPEFNREDLMINRRYLTLDGNGGSPA